MTVKTQMEILNEIIEKMETIKPGEYYAMLETNGLVKFMGRTEERRLLAYVSIDGIIGALAQMILDQAIKEWTWYSHY